MKYNILIPTRDSGEWLDAILTSYKRIKLRPFVVYDARSIDNTYDIIKKHCIDHCVFEAEKDFPEAGMIAAGNSQVEPGWILRMDDDEFPSKSLLEWIKKTSPINTSQVYGISRRDIIYSANQYKFSAWPTRWGAGGDYNLYNPQTRLYHSRSISFSEELHTPGIKFNEPLQYAPNNAYILHFNCLVRNYSKRLEKIKKYAIYERSSWKFVDEALPEHVSSLFDCFPEADLSEFEELLGLLPLKEVSRDLDYSIEKEDLESAFYYTQEWLVKSHELCRHQLLKNQDLLEILLNFMPLTILATINFILSIACRSQNQSNIFHLKNNFKYIYSLKKAKKYRSS